MITKQTTLFRILTRKAVTVLLITVTAFAAFATLGDGKSKKNKSPILNRTNITPGKFSLKSGYQYRGSQLINQQKTNSTITLNSLVTYQKGNMTYIVPLKTTVFTGNVKLSVGVPQLNRN